MVFNCLPGAANSFGFTEKLSKFSFLNHIRIIETHIEFYVLSLCFVCPMWFEYPIRTSFQLNLDSI